jgi:autotransporter translocation and assembly factor TamB
MVASWAVSLQLRGWLSKDEDKLTREDVKDRQEKLKVLCDWIKTVENHVYAQAYTQWAQSMAIKLNSASNRLDHNEIASALLLHGLPALPDGAK